MKPYEAPEIQAKLAKVKEAVLSVVPDTESIYLFGSYVNGAPHEYSDLDLFVVVPDSDQDFLKLYLALQSAISTALERFEAFDLLINFSTNFYKNINLATFDRIAATTGVKIYG